ncbi:MAG: HIT family protein [Bacteroidia bacterium]
MASIFTKIINGEIHCYKVAEDDKHIAFLDAFPLKKGHVLVVPKKETDYLFDIEATEYIAFMLFAQQVAKAMKQVLPCKKIGVAVVGLEVPHAHIHLIPINSVSDMNFANEKLQLPKDEMEHLAKEILIAYSVL